MTALGWTLLHSLWQGALLGLLAWIALALARNRSARFRHGLCVVFLLALLASFLATWAWLGLVDSGPRVEFLVHLGQAPAPIQARTTLPLAGSMAGNQGWLLTIGTPLGTFWCLGVALMLLRLGGSGFQTRRLLRSAEPAPAEWLRAVDRIARTMGVRQPVSLRVGPHGASPFVWGYFRPVILLPAAALLHLEPAALEAILTHELAHLRRRDSLLLLLQHLAETLLFFHPAAWWLSRQLRTYREHCCDDMAVALLGDPLPYAEALARLETLRQRHPGGMAPAVTHAAHRGSLMNRIQRMLTPGPDPVPAFRSLTLAMALAAGGGGLLLARPTLTPPANAPQSAGVVVHKDADTIQLTGFTHEMPSPSGGSKAWGLQWKALVEEARQGLEARLRALDAPTPPALPAPLPKRTKQVSIYLAHSKEAPEKKLGMSWRPPGKDLALNITGLTGLSEKEALRVALERVQELREVPPPPPPPPPPGARKNSPPPPPPPPPPTRTDPR